MTTTSLQPSIVRYVDIAVDHPAFEGHFPGRPILPGVALVAEVLEAALDEPSLAERIGASPRLDVVKFLAPVLPGAHLSIRFRAAPGGVEFVVEENDRIAASGKLSAGATRATSP